MSNFFKAFKNLGKLAQNNHSVPEELVSSATMASRVVLNNGLKMPRVGRKYIAQSHCYGNSKRRD